VADTKVSALPSLSGANAAGGDVLPIVDVSVPATKGISLSELAAALKLLGFSLDDLSDVAVTSPAANNTLLYSGTVWANGPINSNAVLVDSTNIINSTSLNVQQTLVDLDAAIQSAAGTGIPATLFDAVGDLLIGSADNTGVKLTKGSNYTSLSVNGSGTVGYNDVRAFPRTVNTQTGTTYTAVLGDAGGITTLNNASSITYTVPPASSVAYPANTVIDLIQYGAGQVTVAAGAGVTIQTSSSLKLRTQWSAATLVLTATADQWVLVGDLEPLGQSINAQTGTTYTFVLTDTEKLVTASNASAQTYTVPANATSAFNIGTHIDLIQIGAGQVTIAAAGGVTVNATPTLKLRAQHSGASLEKIATNTWQVVGDMAAS
jgi:hypothetical protein